MERKCMIANCDQPSESFCSNCRFNKLFCLTHRMDHCKNYPDHDVVVFMVDVNDELTKHWTCKVLSSLDRLKDSRKKYSAFIHDLFGSIHKEYQKVDCFFHNIEKNCLALLKKVRNLPGKILSTDLNVLQSCLEMEFKDFSSCKDLSFLTGFTIEMQTSAIRFYNEVFKSYELSDGLEMMQEFSNFYSLIRNPHLEIIVEEPEPDVLIFYVDGQHLRKFDIQTLSSSVVIFNDKVNPGLGASAVRFEGNIWYYSYQKDAYLLDFDKSISQKFKESVTRSYYLRGMVYHKSKLYLFGGVGGNHGQIQVRESEVYSQSCWKSIALLPNVLKSTSAKVLNDKIYIVGYNNNSLLTYDESKDSYKDVMKLSESPVCKILCGKFILLNRSRIVWIIENNEFKQVTVNQDIICDSLAINSVFENEKFCYFLVWEGNLLRLTKETLKVEVISTGLVRDY